MLITIKPQSGLYYNIRGRYSAEIDEILEFMIRLSLIKDQLQIEIDPERLRPIDADLQVPNTVKFTKHTDWKAEISIEQTMKNLLNYLRDRIISEGNYFLMR